VHRVQAFARTSSSELKVRSGAASFRFAPFRSASAAYLPTHIQSPRGLRRLSETYLPKVTSMYLYIPYEEKPLIHFSSRITQISWWMWA
ncbi:MAG: hypothetical protein Q4B68_08375, partial [Bacteroidales bacterium]|nr:hypothetical protein [Bacteroidales bacterium]